MRPLTVALMVAAFGISANTTSGRPAVDWATTGAAAATKVTYWSPFGASGNLRPALTYSVKFGGDCWTGSFIVHDAYRCMDGHYIYDPCWRDPNTDEDIVVCASSPAERRVLKLHVSGQMNHSYSGRSQAIWALRVRGEGECVWVSGATNAVDGKRLNYFCQRHHGVIYGNVDRRGRVWHAYFTTNTDGVGMRRVPVKHVWIGKAEP